MRVKVRFPGIPGDLVRCFEMFQSKNEIVHAIKRVERRNRVRNVRERLEEIGLSRATIMFMSDDEAANALGDSNHSI